MTLEEKVSFYKKYLKKKDAYHHVSCVMNYDLETAMPIKGADAMAQTMGVISEEIYKMETDATLEHVVNELYEQRDKLDIVTRREIEEHKEAIARIDCVPMDEYTEFEMLCNKSNAVWGEAKRSNNYEMFKPYLAKIIEMNKKFSLYYAPGKDPYETLLDQYEKGLTKDALDRFFAEIDKEFGPLVRKVVSLNSKIDDSFIYSFASIEDQRRISEEIMKVMCIDTERCTIGEVEHPFTDGFNKNDVRITTHYHEDNFVSSFYSVVHEGGHGLCALGTGDNLIGSPLANDASMSIAESQSRFFENYIGRSREFITYMFPILKKIIPNVLEGKNEIDLYKAVNKCQPSLIRTEADELTYVYHVRIRYELEKALFDGTLTVDDLPREWARLYKEYLGVDVPDDTHGVLQDSHWAGGSFGYFPSYALGSAYGAQILNAMKKEIDVYGNVAKGDLKPVIKWLEDHIWSYGMIKTPQEVIFDTTGEDFNPKYFTEYMKNKISDVYEK